MQARRRGAAETRGHLHVRFKEGDHHDQQMRIDAEKRRHGHGGVQGLLAERPWPHRKQDGESAQVRPARRSRCRASPCHRTGFGGYRRIFRAAIRQLRRHGRGRGVAARRRSERCPDVRQPPLPNSRAGQARSHSDPGVPARQEAHQARVVSRSRRRRYFRAIRQRMVERARPLGADRSRVRRVQPGSRHRPHRRRRIRSVRGASCRRRRGDVVRNERSVRRVLRFPRIRARLCAQLGVHRGDQHLPDRYLSACLADCRGACDLPSKKLRFSKEEAREKGSTI